MSSKTLFLVHMLMSSALSAGARTKDARCNTLNEDLIVSESRPLLLSTTTTNWYSGEVSKRPYERPSEDAKKAGNVEPLLDHGSKSVRSLPLLSESKSERSNKLKALLDVSEQLQQLTIERNVTLASLCMIFGRISSLARSEEPIGDLEAATVGTIMMHTAEFIASTTGDDPCVLPSGAFIGVGFSLGSYELSSYFGSNVFEDISDRFFIEADPSLFGFDHKTGYVIYQKNSSPLRPLPVTVAPITRYRVFDLVLGSRDVSWWNPRDNTMSMRWEYATPAGNARYGCASWNQTDTEWSTLSCAVINVPLVVDLGLPFQVVCYCQLIFNGNISEYIMYQYIDEIQTTIHFDNLSLSDANTTDAAKNYSEYNSLLSNLSMNVNTPDLLATFHSTYLSKVMLFDNDVLISTSSDKVLEDIGTILAAVTPDQGRHTIGHRDNLLASFVVQSDPTNQRDLPIGFGVYNDFTSGIECFMATEDIDPNILFSSQMNFSLLFSNSVVQQNSRYAFLLYPPNKFFKPAAFIDGQQIRNMRVVDIVLNLKNHELDEDQLLVHMYYGALTNEYIYDCAYWSASLGDWETSGCYNNPRLFTGVCTCDMSVNFKESRTRGQYVILFEYVRSKNYEFRRETKVAEERYGDDASILLALHNLKMCDYYPKLADSFVPFLEFGLVILWWHPQRSYVYTLKESTKKKVINVIRNAVITNEEFTTYFQIYTPNIITVCSKNDLESVSKTTFYLSGFDGERNGVAYYSLQECAATAEYNETDSSSGEKRLFTLHVSNSVVAENERHAFLLYPKNAFVRPPPSIGTRFSSRVVDVVLKPRITVHDVPQYVEFTFDRPAEQTLGCGVWDDVVEDWTAHSCHVVRIAFVAVCNCSLTGDGGQFIVYSYTDAVFDLEVFERFGAESFTDTASIFDQGAALVHNASLLEVDSRSIVGFMNVFKKLVSHMDDLVDGRQRMGQILHDINATQSRLGAGGSSVQIKYDCPDAWDLKSAELAVSQISSDVNTSINSDMAFVAIGKQYLEDAGFSTYYKSYHGLQYSRGHGDGVKFVDSRDETEFVVQSNPYFACFFTTRSSLYDNRAIFVVYPLNVSPFPFSMSAGPVFNSRQVDVYLNEFRGENSETLEIYFQPTDDPASYIKTACAVWNETAYGWSHNSCTMYSFDNRPVCSCFTTALLLVAKITIYEYTDQANFVLSDYLGGSSVLYLVGATFSLQGLVLIAVTAVLFPEWRQELGNTVLVHLSLSYFLYLTITMFRETHTIYADMKHLDVGLVVFTVCVHYTRLVHHCWGLVMSVLQYKRFSGVVGASASTSHLLLKVSALAWGVPLLPLAVLLCWDVKIHFCTPDKMTHYILYLVPVVVITLLNIGFLVAILRVITNGCGLCDDEELQRKGGASKDSVIQLLKQIAMMFVLFGIPIVSDALDGLVLNSAVVVYIGKIITSFQGFAVFLFFVMFNDKTRDYWVSYGSGDTPVVTNRPGIKSKKVKPKLPKTAIEMVAISQPGTGSAETAESSL